MADRNLTAEQENAVALAEEISRIRKIRQAFVELFGLPGRRTPQGAIAIEYLERYCGTRRGINETDLHGRTDVYRTARRHGRCDVMQAIHDMIEWKERPDADGSRGS